MTRARAQGGALKRLLIFVYGITTYAIFFCTFLYAIGFVGNFHIELWDGVVFVPKSMDRGGAEASLAEALLIDALLLGVFAVQHSAMARQGFKDRLTRIIPEPAERSTFVLAASAALILLFAFWRPIGGTVWLLGSGLAHDLLIGLSLLGWGIVLISTFLVDHFDLFGLRQVWYALVDRERPPIGFRTPSLYKVVRHPIYFGFVIAFWATPIMTVGHLVFAIGTTGYILVAIQLEERDLIHHFGDTYRAYRRRTSMLIPKPPK
jgi:protein-S-isoprenylcysteine O-methyltransferase Ste14